MVTVPTTPSECVWFVDQSPPSLTMTVATPDAHRLHQAYETDAGRRRRGVRRRSATVHRTGRRPASPASTTNPRSRPADGGTAGNRRRLAGTRGVHIRSVPGISGRRRSTHDCPNDLGFQRCQPQSTCLGRLSRGRVRRFGSWRSLKRHAPTDSHRRRPRGGPAGRRTAASVPSDRSRAATGRPPRRRGLPRHLAPERSRQRPSQDRRSRGWRMRGCLPLLGQVLAGVGPRDLTATVR